MELFDWLIPEQNKRQHHLLGMMYKKVMEHKAHTIDEEKLAVSISSIAGEFGLSENEVRLLICTLTDDEVRFEDYGKGDVIIPRKDTVTSYASRKYIRLGKDRRIARIKDYLTITSLFVAISSTLIASIAALISVKGNSKRIERLETKLDSTQVQKTQP